MATTATSRRASGVEPDAAAVSELARARDLYERHSHTIFAFCYSRLGSREDAEDAAQTTFLNAFRSLQRGVVPELELAWLMKIANHAILNRRRAASRRRRVETPHDPEILQGVAPAHERDADELIGLDRALASMPAQQRRALLLREWQGLSYREIREELGLSQAALEALLFRARRSLASGLEQPHRLRTKRRLGFDLGALLTGAKALLTGGVSSQLAVTSIAVIGTVVGATVPVHQSPRLLAPSRASAAAPLATVLGGVHTGRVGALLPTARTAPAATIASLPGARRIAHPVESSYPAGPTAEPSEAGPPVLPALPTSEETPAVAQSSSVAPSDASPTAPVTPQTEVLPTVPLPLQSDLLAAASSVPPSDAPAAAATRDGSPGQSASAPGRTGLTPPNGSPPPGASSVAPGKSSAAGGAADGTAAPGNSVSAPGHTGATPADAPPPGNRGVVPGKSSAAGAPNAAAAAPGKSGSPLGADAGKTADAVGGAPASSSPRADSQPISTGVAEAAGAVPAAGSAPSSQAAPSGTATGGGNGGARPGDNSSVAAPSGATSGSAGATSAAGAAPSLVDPRSSATGDSSTGNSHSARTDDGGTPNNNQTPNGNASAAVGNPTEPSPTSGAPAAQPSATSTGNGSKGGSSGNGKTH